MTSEWPLSPVLLQRITRDYEEHPGLRSPPSRRSGAGDLMGPRAVWCFQR